MNDMADRPSAQPGADARAAPLYWAFLSYSHRDSKLAGWLHGAERLRGSTPENTEWLQVGAELRGDLARLMPDLGRLADGAPLIETGCEALSTSVTGITRW